MVWRKGGTEILVHEILHAHDNTGHLERVHGTEKGPRPSVVD